MTVPLFNKTFKLFVFKGDNEVSISLRITDKCCRSFMMPLEDFTYIINNWRTGVDGRNIDGNRWWWEYRDCGPRPEIAPADFVSISVHGWNWRVTVAEMEELESAFNFQLINKNHWD